VLLHVQGAYRGSVPAAHLGCKFTRVAAWLSASQHVLCSGLSHDVACSGVMNGPAWHAHCLEALQSRAGCIVPCRLLHVCMYVCLYVCVSVCMQHNAFTMLCKSCGASDQWRMAIPSVYVAACKRPLYVVACMLCVRVSGSC
jgi:hypothetical protein